MSDMPLFEDQDDRDIMTVSEFTQRVKRVLESGFRSQWVRGEISEITRPRSGHIYLTMKDSGAQVRAVVWRTTALRLKVDLEIGQEIICRGDVDLYPPRGSYQLVLQSVEPVGEGALRLRLRKLQQKLAGQGLFDAERKKPIPRFPRFLAVVTSPTGAAVKDFLEVSRRRWSGVRVMIIPTQVQGQGAAQQIARGLRAVHRMAEAPDVVVVARGGGSLEDLWCFNDERVVRAVADCRVPVVSAVGHEVDVTLCDLAADLRALTPTEAAERILPSRSAVIDVLHETARRLQHCLRQRIEHGRGQLETLAGRRVLQHPMESIYQWQRRLDQIDSRIGLAMKHRLQACRNGLAHVTSKLDALSPLAVLARGYSLTTTIDGSIVDSARQLKINDLVVTKFGEGRMTSQVVDVENTPPAEPKPGENHSDTQSSTGSPPQSTAE